MSVAWILLILAGLFEIGWPLGLKLGNSETGLNWGWIGFALLSMVISGTLLFIAQKSIPMGTAYAVWTGIGAAGTFIVGIYMFGDAASIARLFSVLLIIAGVVGLKMA